MVYSNEHHDELPLGTEKGRHCQEQSLKKETKSHISNASFLMCSFWDSSRQKPASFITQEQTGTRGQAGEDAAPRQQEAAVAKLKWHNRHKSSHMHPHHCSLPLQKITERKLRAKAAALAGSLNKTAGHAATLQLGCTA